MSKFATIILNRNLPKITDELYKRIKTCDNKKICGTPYGAVSYTSYISIDNNISMLFVRKEKKNHGTKKIIEGDYSLGDEVILIEDVITSGESVINTAEILEKEGLIVTQIIAIFSRNINNLYYRNIPIEYIFNLNDIK